MNPEYINLPEVPCIYKIQNPIGEVYIGNTKNLKKRFKGHKFSSGKKGLLLDSFKQYGFLNHIVDILHELPKDISKEVLNKYEILYIEQYMSNRSIYKNGVGLNLCNGGNGVVGHKLNSEQLERHRQVSIGRIMPKGELSKWFGIKGENHPGFGYKHTEEAKVKISNAQIGGNHNLAQKVIDISNGNIYGSIKEASVFSGLSYSAFKAQINGQNKNITNFRYLNKSKND